MTRKFWRWARNETPDGFGSDRTLYLDGEISDETWYGDEITPRAFKDELNSGKGDITLWINSPGGDVFAAAQIYNMLMDYPYDVTVKIDALAASAASVIAMAGTRVCMSPVAMLMVHNPATIAIGDSEEMQKAIDMLSEVKESIMNAYELKSGLSRNKISKLMDAETWMNAREAKKLGFADEILFSDGTGPAEEDGTEIEMLFSRKAAYLHNHPETRTRAERYETGRQGRRPQEAPVASQPLKRNGGIRNDQDHGPYGKKSQGVGRREELPRHPLHGRRQRVRGGRRHL